MPLKLLDRSVALWQNGSAVGIPRRHGWKTPPGPRGSNGIQSMLVGCGLGGFFVWCGGRLCRVSAVPVGCAPQLPALVVGGREPPPSADLVRAFVRCDCFRCAEAPSTASACPRRAGRRQAWRGSNKTADKPVRGLPAADARESGILSPYFSSMTSSSEMAP